jgi:Domain of unknown function (DUF305)
MNDRNRTRSSLLTAAALLGLVVANIGIASARAQAVAPQDASNIAVMGDEAPFLSENAAAMDRMMAGMDVKPTGDADVDFVAMMIPHHQGAIDMALAELRYGKNEQLRRIAQEIIVDQQQEIAAMRLALGQPLPPSAPAPTQVSRSDAAQSPGTAGHDQLQHGSTPLASPMQMK